MTRQQHNVDVDNGFLLKHVEILSILFDFAFKRVSRRRRKRVFQMTCFELHIEKAARFSGFLTMTFQRLLPSCIVARLRSIWIDSHCQEIWKPPDIPHHRNYNLSLKSMTSEKSLNISPNHIADVLRVATDLECERVRLIFGDEERKMRLANDADGITFSMWREREVMHTFTSRSHRDDEFGWKINISSRERNGSAK